MDRRGRPDDERQHGSENLEDLLGFVVGLAKLNHSSGASRRVHRYGVDVVVIIPQVHTHIRGVLPVFERLAPHVEIGG
jgi:hypothetical protein